MKKWFCWNPSRETYLAILIGLVTIVLSLSLNITIIEKTPLLFILVRDILMIVGIGILFTLQRINSKYDEYDLTFKRLKPNLLINIVLATILAIIMLMDLNYSSFIIDSQVLSKVLYIMLAGIFEVLLFYTYLRVVFEKSFGYVGAAILSSLFYSLHHAGFQPEFGKLIFVGIMYASVYRITNNLLIIFPFFWGIGAIWDVLVNFGTTELEGTKTLLKATCTLILMIGVALYIKRKHQMKIVVVMKKQQNGDFQLSVLY